MKPVEQSRRCIFLIGLRGTGKSTVGRLVAERLGLPFLDADVEFERRTGTTIRDFFAEQGEAAFRDAEELLLAEMASRGPAVVATGGGVVLRPGNLACMKQSGRVFWLTAPPEILWARIAADPSTADRRPNLLAGGVSELVELARSRDPLYRECANVTLDATQQSPEELAEAIVAS